MVKNKIWNEESIRLAVAATTTIVDCLSMIGVTSSGRHRQYLKDYIALYNIDTSHFK